MLYSFKCLQCAEEKELSVPIKEYTHDTHAPSCSAHGKMHQVFNNLGLADAYKQKGRYPYTDTNIGHEPVVVESPQHRQRLLKANGIHDREFSYEAKARAKAAVTKHFSMGKSFR